MMLLTLCKMKEMNDKLFMKAGVSSFKSISSIFNRFTI